MKSTPMLTKQRKQLILSRLRKDGQIVAATFSDELGLSEDTIRRDLRALAAQGLLQRVHGGALPSSPALADFATRSELQTSGKLAIARAAAALVQPGQVVFVDGGTTCQKLAQQLPPELKATVVTHSPTIAVELARSEHPHVDVVLMGGYLFKHSVVALGAATLEAINRVHADLYFMGASGIDVRAGLCTGDLEEADVKRALMARSAQTWVLASQEKLNAASPYLIAPCEAATGIVVERGTPARDIAAFEAIGLKVVRA
jgi:DeoR/GlpR family transcriptional regulator of sugar metabolism